MDSRAALAAIVLALFAQASPPPAPPPPPAPQQQAPRQPTFRSGAELVRVDVTVLDRDGRPVLGLTEDDFVLEEDGVRQRIGSFKFVGLNGQPAPDDDRPLEIRSASHAESELARDDVRVFLVFWDEYHIHPQLHTTGLRQVLVSFLRTMVGPTDLIAFMDPWTPMSHLSFTRDRAVLWNHVLGLKGRQGDYTPRNVAEENHLRDPRAIERRRAEVALSALQSAIMHLGSLREGRKTILYVGREFGLGRDSFSRVQELIQFANDANVAFYSINPDGLSLRGMRFGMLTDLARNTGGEALVTNSPELALRRAVQQASAVYLLGYAPEPLRRDGKFHKIKVRVTRPDVQVRARNGYWAPDILTMTSAKARAAEAVVPGAIEAAFGELSRLERHDSDEPLALKTSFEPGQPSAELAVEAPRLWTVRRPADLRNVLSDTPPEPSVEREFVRTDRLIVRFGVAGVRADAASATADLLDRRGKRLTALPLVRSGAAG